MENFLPPSKDFIDLMALKRVEPGHFVSLGVAYQPIRAPGVYGGHLLAQSLYAASKTIDSPFNEYNELKEGEKHSVFICNNLEAQFLDGNSNRRPFHYFVKNLRDGGRYRVRAVHVVQYKENEIECEENEIPVFSAFVSFKKPENKDDHMVMKEHETESKESWSHLPPGVKLDVEPEKLPISPDLDLPLFTSWATKNFGKLNLFDRAIDVRKVPLELMEQPERYTDRKAYHIYKVNGNLSDDPNLHLCAHIYCSDQNSMFVGSQLLGKIDKIRRVCSLSQSIVFFPSPCNDTIRADDSWTTLETQTTRSGDGRLLYTGKLYDANGVMFGEFIQDGLALYSKM
ncbi:thioesterase-like superfamily-domain-containing protein [Dipodascopsis uninucleata]